MLNETQLFQNLSSSFDPICRSICVIYVRWSLFRNFLSPSSSFPSLASMKLSLDDISRFLFSYNNLWPNEAHPPDFRIFSFFLADVSWPLSLFLESAHLSTSLSPVLILFNQSFPGSSYLRHLFRPLFFFLPSTSRTFPKRNELFGTWRFRGVSFTVAQVSRLSQLRFVDVFSQLLLGRSCLRGTSVTCSFSHLTVVFCVSSPTQISITIFICQHLVKNYSANGTSDNHDSLDFDIHYIIHILLINPRKFFSMTLSAQISREDPRKRVSHRFTYFRHICTECNEKNKAQKYEIAIDAIGFPWIS